MGLHHFSTHNSSLPSLFPLLPPLQDEPKFSLETVNKTRSLKKGVCGSSSLKRKEFKETKEATSVNWLCYASGGEEGADNPHLG